MTGVPMAPALSVAYLGRKRYGLLLDGKHLLREDKDVTELVGYGRTLSAETIAHLQAAFSEPDTL